MFEPSFAELNQVATKYDKVCFTWPNLGTSNMLVGADVNGLFYNVSGEFYTTRLDGDVFYTM